MKINKKLLLAITIPTLAILPASSIALVGFTQVNSSQNLTFEQINEEIITFSDWTVNTLTNQMSSTSDGTTLKLNISINDENQITIQQNYNLNDYPFALEFNSITDGTDEYIN